MTLEEFLARGPRAYPRNAYVEEQGFQVLYVRWGHHLVDSEIQACFDIAVVEAEEPGGGAFKRLVGKIQRATPGTPIFVECVQSTRFAEGLLRMGFQAVNESYVL